MALLFRRMYLKRRKEDEVRIGALMRKESRRWDEPLEPVGSSLLGLISDVLSSLDGEYLKEKERMERKSVDARRVEEGSR